MFEELGSTVDEAHIELDNPAPTFQDIFYANNYTSYGHLLDENPGLLTDNARFCLVSKLRPT